MIDRTFRTFVALLLAVPLGAGGLCCCLLGSACDREAVTVAEPRSACCAEVPDPAAERECECPERDPALAQTAAPDGLLPVSAAHGLAMAPEPGAGHAMAPPVEANDRRLFHPPRKKPIYRTLSVLRC